MRPTRSNLRALAANCADGIDNKAAREAFDLTCLEAGAYINNAARAGYLFSCADHKWPHRGKRWFGSQAQADAWCARQAGLPVPQVARAPKQPGAAAIVCDAVKASRAGLTRAELIAATKLSMEQVVYGLDVARRRGVLRAVGPSLLARWCSSKSMEARALDAIRTHMESTGSAENKRRRSRFGGLSRAECKAAEDFERAPIRIISTNWPAPTAVRGPASVWDLAKEAA